MHHQHRPETKPGVRNNIYLIIKKQISIHSVLYCESTIIY